MEISLDTPYAIKDHVNDVLSFSGGVKIWVFIGEMGAGKTTTIKSICEELGVADDVSSPTFALVNEYTSTKAGTIYHFDCYRIESEKENIQIGFEDYFYSGNLCFIEWPDKIANLIPDECLIFRIEKIDENKRLLKIIRND